MVRRSLAETLSEQALQFLKEGSEVRPENTATAKVVQGPLPGFERAFHLEFWNREDREQLHRFFVDKYCEDLERAGIKTTRDGLVEPSRTHVPNTKGLDVEIRWLRREVALLSELVRNLLRIVVDAGGIEPERLRDYLCEIAAAAPAEAPAAVLPVENTLENESSVRLAGGANAEIVRVSAPVEVRVDSIKSRPGNGYHAAAPATGELLPLAQEPETATLTEEARLAALAQWVECGRCGRELPTTVSVCLFCGKELSEP